MTENELNPLGVALVFVIWAMVVYACFAIGAAYDKWREHR